MPILVYLLAVAVFAQGTSEFMLAGLLPGIGAELGVSLGTAGLLTSGFALGMVVGAPTMAALARRLSPRWALSGFLAGFVASHIVGALALDFGTLLGSRAVAALANAGFLAVALSTVVRVVAPQRHARALSVILGGTTLALIAGVPAGALAGATFGWRATLWIVAALCLPALLAVLFAAPARPDHANGSTPTLRQEVAVLARRPVQRKIALAALANAATFCTFTYLAPIAVDGARMGAESVPAVLALFGIGSLFGVLISGRFGDRSWRTLIGVSAPFAVIGWLLLAALVESAAGVWALVLPLGAVSFCLGSALVARVVAAATDAPTLGGSFATSGLNLGAVIGPVAGGAALGGFGMVGPVLSSAGFAVLAVALWAAGARRKRGDAAA